MQMDVRRATHRARAITVTVGFLFKKLIEGDGPRGHPAELCGLGGFCAFRLSRSFEAARLLKAAGLLAPLVMAAETR